MGSHRIGLIVSSLNIMKRTENPALLRFRKQVSPQRLTFHSSRMRMKHVTKILAAIDADSARCALKLNTRAPGGGTPLSGAY